MLPARCSRASETGVLPSQRDRYRLGSLSVGASPVCLGMVGDPRVVPAAFDAGINFFFVTADLHWPLYERMRRGLTMLLARGGGVRDEMVVAVVSYVSQPEFCLAPFREAVDAIPGLGRADVTVAGGAYAHDLLPRLVEYRRHRDGELPGVRGTAASFHDRAAAREAIRHDLVDLAFVRYNPVHRGAQVDLFPHVPPPRRTLVYTFKSSLGHLPEEAYSQLGVAADAWRPRVTDYYRYALTRPEVDGLLCALHEERHVAELGDALGRGPLDDEELRYLENLADVATGRSGLESPATERSR